MKEYLGDSVYVDFDGFYITLTTDNGDGPTNTIFMEPEVYHALVEYQKRLLKVQQKFLLGDQQDASVVTEEG